MQTRVRHVERSHGACALATRHLCSNIPWFTVVQMQYCAMLMRRMTSHSLHNTKYTWWTNLDWNTYHPKTNETRNREKKTVCELSPLLSQWVFLLHRAHAHSHTHTDWHTIEEITNSIVPDVRILFSLFILLSVPIFGIRWLRKQNERRFET